jgi:selenocysteine-specific translation elongation factor
MTRHRSNATPKRTTTSTPPPTPPGGAPTALRAFTVGTAGHVDHGKSALVKALTGTDPDRLKEEKERGMTIVLGFAELRLPSGRRCDLVDTPGHESLIRTMVSGACGLDAVVLCVDGREGVMPQTREHAQILGLLGVSRGIVAITKADLLAGPDERAAASACLRSWLRGTAFADAPVVFTSAQTGEGLDALCGALDWLLEAATPRDHHGPVRLPVDRAFVIPGAGCVVTGTLWSGTLKPGLPLVLLPQEREVRVRGLQVHGEAVPLALAGERPAINLTGVEAKEVASGSQLVDPRAFTTTRRFTARLTVLPDTPPLRRRAAAELLAGTANARAHLVVLETPNDQQAAAASAEPVALIRLDTPLVLAFGDVAILRTTGGERTIGAARVLDIAPPQRISLGVGLARTLATATPREAAREFARTAGLEGRQAMDLQRRLGVSPDGLAVLVRSHRRYWHEDALDAARRALVLALPAPGRSLWLEHWWRASPIQDRTVLWTLTRDIAHVYGLRVHDGLVVTPPSPGSPVAPGITRRVERALYVDAGRVVPVASLAETVGLPQRDVRRALRALIADGVAVRISDRCVCHRKVLAGLIRELSALGTAPDSEARARLGLSRSATRDLLGYLGSIGVGARTGRAFAVVPIRIRAREHSPEGTARAAQRTAQPNR